MAELGADSAAVPRGDRRASRRSSASTWSSAIGPQARALRRRDWCAEPATRRSPLLESCIQPGDCVLVKGARALGLERVAEALTHGARVVVDVLIAGIVAMVISIVAGPRFIALPAPREYGQPIREEGPAGHVVKQGTPTMGGLLIIVRDGDPVPDPERVHDARAVASSLVTLGCAPIGFLDDFIKLTHQRSLGPARPLEAPAAGAITDRGRRLGRAPPPLLDRRLPPGDRREAPALLGVVPLLFLIIAGAANGVNLTDGLDGLAAGTGIIAIFTFTAMTRDRLHPLGPARAPRRRSTSTCRSSAPR